MQSEKTPSLIKQEDDDNKSNCEQPEVLDEIIVEELTIDGICGVY